MSFERFALIVTSTTLLALGTLHWAGVTGNLTESEPPGLYFRTLTSPRRGAMVELRPLMKHVAAIAGDTVRVTPEGSYVNGRLWPNSAIPTDTYGFQPFRFGTYKLQPGQYWVLGSSSDSYDSRWFGPIHDDVVAFRIKPLWTTSNGYAPGTK